MIMVVVCVVLLVLVMLVEVNETAKNDKFQQLIDRKELVRVS